jgi:hypothetical protein
VYGPGKLKLETMFYSGGLIGGLALSP